MKWRLHNTHLYPPLLKECGVFTTDCQRVMASHQFKFNLFTTGLLNTLIKGFG